MNLEPYRWIAGVIAAHKDRRVVGRTRLQKTIKLLQRKGLPTELGYSIHFYGPYSEGLNSELRFLKQFQLVTEEVKESEQSDQHYYVYTAEEAADLPLVQDFVADIRVIEAAKDIPLELAATYDTFREMGFDHAESLKRLREKKGAKCKNGNEEAALDLLQKLALPTA